MFTLKVEIDLWNMRQEFQMVKWSLLVSNDILHVSKQSSNFINPLQWKAPRIITKAQFAPALSQRGRFGSKTSLTLIIITISVLDNKFEISALTEVYYLSRLYTGLSILFRLCALHFLCIAHSTNKEEFGIITLHG